MKIPESPSSGHREDNWPFSSLLRPTGQLAGRMGGRGSSEKTLVINEIFWRFPGGMGGPMTQRHDPLQHFPFGRLDGPSSPPTPTTGQHASSPTILPANLQSSLTLTHSLSRTHKQSSTPPFIWWFAPFDTFIPSSFSASNSNNTSRTPKLQRLGPASEQQQQHHHHHHHSIHHPTTSSLARRRLSSGCHSSSCHSQQFAAWSIVRLELNSSCC